MGKLKKPKWIHLTKPSGIKVSFRRKDIISYGGYVTGSTIAIGDEPPENIVTNYVSTIHEECVFVEEDHDTIRALLSLKTGDTYAEGEIFNVNPLSLAELTSEMKETIKEHLSAPREIKTKDGKTIFKTNPEKPQYPNKPLKP